MANNAEGAVGQNPISPSQGSPAPLTEAQAAQAEEFFDKLKRDSELMAYNWIRSQVPPALMDRFLEMFPAPKKQSPGPVDRNDWRQFLGKTNKPLPPDPAEGEVELLQQPGVDLEGNKLPPQAGGPVPAQEQSSTEQPHTTAPYPPQQGNQQFSGQPQPHQPGVQYTGQQVPGQPRRF